MILAQRLALTAAAAIAMNLSDSIRANITDSFDEARNPVQTAPRNIAAWAGLLRSSKREEAALADVIAFCFCRMGVGERAHVVALAAIPDSLPG